MIDDGSKDDSTRVIESVLRDCPFACELIARENRGLSATLNQALSLMDGHYFAYLGSDDMWLADFLAARVKLREVDHQLSWVTVIPTLSTREKQGCGLYGRVGRLQRRRCAADAFTNYRPDEFYSSCYVRKLLARHGWNTEARLEDYELYLRLSLDGEFAFDPGVRSTWRQHEKNASRNQAMMLDEHVSALQRVGAIFWHSTARAGQAYQDHSV